MTQWTHTVASWGQSWLPANRRRRLFRFSAISGAGFAILMGVVLTREYYPSTLPAAQSITVTATPIAFDRLNPERVRFGRMRWIGGLLLTADLGHFGGYSGLSLDKTGTRLFAISDAGSWLSADLEFRNGRPSGLSNARTGPILDQNGAPLRRKKYKDAEGLTALNPGADDGEWLISFEHDHRIVHYRFANGTLSVGEAIPLAEAARRLRANEGIEGLTVLRAGTHKGAILTFAENKKAQADETIGWLIKDGAASELRVNVTDQYSVTDLASLANGDVLVLERRFLNPFDGVRMRLARIAVGDIKPGALIQPELLLEADRHMNIDNMEGLAVTERPDGVVVVTMISDDNFMPVQQTVLLQFALERGS